MRSIDNDEYEKRQGTAGIRGQLYETKLISLIYFRAIHDNNIEEFKLASNMNGIGVFDDICLRIKMKEFEKPIAVFIQAKHRENNKALTLNSSNDISKYFESYLNIRRAFELRNNEKMFKGTFHETKCVFAMYTTVKGDHDSRPIESNLAKQFDDLIKTGDSGSHPSSKMDVKFLCSIVLKEEIATLAKQMLKFVYEKNVCKEKMDNVMDNDLMLRYHVILVQKVFEVSDILPEGHRIASFRQDFFKTDELRKDCIYIQIFKDILCTEIMIRLKKEKTVLPLCFDGEHRIEVLSQLLESNVVYKNGKFEFLDKTIPEDAAKEREVVELALKRYLLSRKLKVPKAFGNKDLTMTSNEAKIERRLNYLSKKIGDLIEKSKPNKIVTLNESLEEGFLQLNGGITSAVGNIFVSDDTSNLIKITDSSESLGNLAKRLFEKLGNNIDNLQEFKFDVNIKKFPKLSFETGEFEEQLVTDFLSKLLFYTNQAEENTVEKILKISIEAYQSSVDDNKDISPDAIFLQYHDDIQKWWMDKKGVYLTERSETYENAVRFVNQSIIRKLQKIEKNKKYSFKDDVINLLKLHEQPSGSLIVTKNNTLTVAKFKQYYGYNLTILDLTQILYLSATDFKALCEELKKTNETKTIIIVIDRVENTTLSNNSNKLQNIANIVKEKNHFIITNNKCEEVVKECFSLTDNEVNKRDEVDKLTDMSKESQQSVLRNNKVRFQGNEVSLDKIIDDFSIEYIKGDVLNVIVNGYGFWIGKPYQDLNYLKLPEYIPRLLSTSELKRNEKVESVFSEPSDGGRNVIQTKIVKVNNSLEIETFYDLTGDVVLIIADPGMGKSTLLTHFFLETKKLDEGVWIVRINLLAYLKEFNKWQENKTVIDTLESLKFICNAAVCVFDNNRKINEVLTKLEESRGVATLKDCTADDLDIFQLKMFIHYYNTGRLIFLLDGFDEICPAYSQEVLSLIKVMKSYPQKHKIWITSKSYEKMQIISELELRKFYEIEPWSFCQQEQQLKLFWNYINHDLNLDQLKNVYDFIRCLSKNDVIEMLLQNSELPIQSRKKLPFLVVYFSFLKYLKTTLNFAPTSVMDTLYELCDEFDSITSQLQSMNEFVVTPLHLNITAKYLIGKIKQSIKQPDNLCLETSVFNIYKSFLKSNFDANELRPDNNLFADSFTKHKQLAAFAVFNRFHSKLFDTNALKEVKKMAFMHFLHCVTPYTCGDISNVCVFEHWTFAEQAAIEYICDLLKSDANKNRESIWDLILNDIFYNYNLNVLVILDDKIQTDEQLITAVEKDGKVIFELLLQQNKAIEMHGDIKSTLCVAVRNNLRNLAYLLLSAINSFLDKNNLMDFITIVKQTKMLAIASKMEFEEIIATVVDHVRKIDEHKLFALFENIENLKLSKNIDEISTDELVQQLLKLHINVETVD